MELQKNLEIISSLIKEIEKIQKVQLKKAQFPTDESWRKSWNIIKKLIEQLMDKILKLYLAIKNNPTLLLNSQIEFKNYLEESGYNLRGLFSELGYYVFETEGIFRFIFDGGEWKRACWRRSAIEALKEMYKNTSLEEYYSELDTLDTEDLDEMMENRGRKEGGLKEEEIPKGIPPSHWWWWYPDPPPETSVF